MTDIVLNKDKGYYDFSWNDSGDFEADDFFDTAILLSIFDEKRADESEIELAHLRRGWIGNETTPDFEQGSKQWEFEQERITGSNLLALGDTIRKGLQWLIDDGIVTKINVLQPQLRNGAVQVPIDFFRDGAEVETRFYNLWDNSGKF